MKTPKSKDYFNFYSGCYNDSLREKNYKEALTCATKGYLISKDIDDKFYEEVFLTLMWTVHKLMNEHLEKKVTEAKQGLCCSFCGRKADEVKLMAGALGSICQICAAQVHEYFTKEQ